MSLRYDVLVIEDEKVVIDSVKKILIPEGFTIDETFDVERALLNLKKNKYKLILTDLMLPKISGLKLIETVNEKYPDIPIIMITGYATLEIAVQSLKLGAFDFIPKPFAFAELLGVVHRAIKFVEIRKSSDSRAEFRKQYHQQHHLDDKLEYYYFLGKHIWTKLDQNGSAKVGVDETFSKTIGEIHKIDFPSVNEIISQGNPLARIYTNENFMHTIWAPLSGKVIENNQELEKVNTLIDKNRLFHGWLVCMIPTNLEEELQNLILC